MSDTDIERRTFLCVLGAAGAAGMGALPGCGNGAATQGTTPFDAGAVTDYTAPVWKMFSANNVIVGRDATGFFAYTNICTHQSCPVAFDTPTDATGDVSTTGSSNCGCHGSRFRSDGSVSQGPARSPLEHFAVTVSGGRVTVNPGTVVPAATRTTA